MAVFGGGFRFGFGPRFRPGFGFGPGFAVELSACPLFYPCNCDEREYPAVKWYFTYALGRKELSSKQERGTHMECKKLTDKEYSDWMALSDLEYADSPLHNALDEESFYVISAICGAAATDDFEWMLDIINNHLEVVAQASSIDGFLQPDPDKALRLYNEAELGYYRLIESGLSYYGRQLDQVIEGQKKARAASQELHHCVRAQ